MIDICFFIIVVTPAPHAEQWLGHFFITRLLAESIISSIYKSAIFIDPNCLFMNENTWKICSVIRQNLHNFEIKCAHIKLGK